MSASKKLTKHDITMLGIRSSFLQASFNYERMQACGFTWAMLPALEKVYGDDKEKLSAAMTDNLEFINTHPNLVGFLMGLMMQSSGSPFCRLSQVSPVPLHHRDPFWDRLFSLRPMWLSGFCVSSGPVLATPLEHVPLISSQRTLI